MWNQEGTISSVVCVLLNLYLVLIQVWTISMYLASVAPEKGFTILATDVLWVW